MGNDAGHRAVAVDGLGNFHGRGNQSRQQYVWVESITSYSCRSGCGKNYVRMQWKIREAVRVIPYCRCRFEVAGTNSDIVSDSVCAIGRNGEDVCPWPVGLTSLYNCSALETSAVSH